ncbi:DUF1479-domain-containing protein [Xylariaceae sp. FL0594]|nr:DUF1479-domain-containing protein [Xylariaceae sp. FL0594]
MIAQHTHDLWSGERPSPPSPSPSFSQQDYSSTTSLFLYESSKTVRNPATPAMADYFCSTATTSTEPIPLSSRFAKLKRNMIACRERDVAESFYRLLRELRKEADEVARLGTDAIPTIDYFDIHDAAKAAAFRASLRKRGVAVIKRVIPPAVAQAWKEETLDYMADNPNMQQQQQQQQRKKNTTTTPTLASDLMMDLDSDMGGGMDMDMAGLGGEFEDMGDFQLSSPPPQKLDGLYDIYWSPGQVRARADSRLLEAQRFAMETWHATGDEDSHLSLVGPHYPVAYADRLRVRTTPSPSDSTFGLNFDGGGGGVLGRGNGGGSRNVGIHVDNGSVERWEPDGYGASGTYAPVFDGRWEDYDPWDSRPRLRITTDLYNRAGSCSMFRMFQGFLSLSSIPAGGGALTVCPMLQLSTAYLLLRPFFTPRFKSPSDNTTTTKTSSSSTATARTEAEYLHPNNWNLNVSQTSVLHGAVPGSVQEVDGSLHPHLQLRRTTVSIPDVEPGDYVIWHPDAIHDVDSAPIPLTPPSDFLDNNSNNSSSSSGSESSSLLSSRSNSSGNIISHSPHSSSSSLSSSYSRPYTPLIINNLSFFSPPSTKTSSFPGVNPRLKEKEEKEKVVLYIPACPLTQTNALYLSRQRRSFLLGQPAPDFSSYSYAYSTSTSTSGTEHNHPGRPGVQDVADAGGDEGLRSMGLAPWDETLLLGSHHDGHNNDRGACEKEKDARLLRLANDILFPDRFDGVSSSKKTGRR